MTVNVSLPLLPWNVFAAESVSPAMTNVSLPVPTLMLVEIVAVVACTVITSLPVPVRTSAPQGDRSKIGILHDRRRKPGKRRAASGVGRAPFTTAVWPVPSTCSVLLPVLKSKRSGP